MQDGKKQEETAAGAGEGQSTRVDADLAAKGKSLTELLALMDDYAPIIPDAVTD
ncbi:MAG: hypothetical protein SGCHY_004334, partial [Lobulomycetales sp.]